VWPARRALLFRDCLRAHPAAVPAYAAFKAMRADCVADLATYAEVNDPAVDLVIAVAEPWGRRDGVDSLTLALELPAQSNARERGPGR
jgi:hypothetical protein